MMKLFAVAHKADTKKPTPPFFSSKGAAKSHRDTLEPKGEYIITPGPDHRKYKHAA